MLFDDDFAIGAGSPDLGGWASRNDEGFGFSGLTGFGELNSFGDPSQFGLGGVVVTGRHPGALYLDDFSAGETVMEHVLPFTYIDQNLVGIQSDETQPDSLAAVNENLTGDQAQVHAATGFTDGLTSGEKTIDGGAMLPLIAASPSIGGFLIVDTPYALGDSQLPASLRPSLNALLGLGIEEDIFVLPADGARSWVLGRTALH
jgi:hypothetical protein